MAENEKIVPFTEAGECLDEIIFEFDDGKQLFVSQNFLYYVSPVFKAMFEHDFREKETRVVKLKGKQYEYFLEFLLCLHPDEQKQVDEGNVLNIVWYADEYQARMMIRKCKNVMSQVLQSKLASAKSTNTEKEILKAALACLQILTAANQLIYEDIVSEACEVLGKFGHAYFTGTITNEQLDYYYYWSDKQKNNQVESKKLYDELPEKIKNKILLARLHLRDNLEML